MARPKSITVTPSPASGNSPWTTGDYAYDGAGNIKAMGAGGAQDQFRYDRFSRLVEAKLQSRSPMRSQVDTFDACGNVTSVFPDGSTTENFPVLGTTNRLSSASCDAGGNLTAWNGNAHGYDLFNAMTDLCTSGTLSARSGERWTYVYTADDERLWAFRSHDAHHVWTVRGLGNQLPTRDEWTGTEAVSFPRASYSVSERRACRSIGSDRLSCRYRKRRREPGDLIERVQVLAASKPRYGHRRLALLLRREGHLVNVKRVHRLSRQLGLSVQRRRRKRAAAQARRPSALPTRANERWSMDFVADSRSDGRAIRLLTIADDFTRESVAIEVGASPTGRHVAAVLERLRFSRGLPDRIVVGNGTEFTSKAVDHRAGSRGVDLLCIRPGRAVEHRYIESFNGRLRDECHNQSWFEAVDDARRIVEAWRKEYNGERPHSSLGGLTPAEFAAPRSPTVPYDRQTPEARAMTINPPE